jgi:pimeloyl-ACP methyl ester carboxylesterase
MLTERQFHTGLITLNYATGPPGGRPLVLLHGFMGCWQDWLPLVPALSAGWRLFAPDMRGHGRSDRAPDGVYRHTDALGDLLAFLDGVIGEPTVLFGHSAGAPVAVEAAGRLPEAVRGVVVGDFPLDIPWLVDLVGSPTLVAYHIAIRRIAGGETEAALPMLAELHPDFGPAQRSVMADALASLDPRAVDCHAEGRLGDYYGDLDGDALLREVACPLALLQSDPDRGGLMPDEYVQRALPLLRHGTHLRLDGIDHSMGIDTGTVGPLLRALVPYLDSL